MLQLLCMPMCCCSDKHSRARSGAHHREVPAAIANRYLTKYWQNPTALPSRAAKHAGLWRKPCAIEADAVNCAASILRSANSPGQVSMIAPPSSGSSKGLLCKALAENGTAVCLTRILPHYKALSSFLIFPAHGCGPSILTPSHLFAEEAAAVVPQPGVAILMPAGRVSSRSAQHAPQAAPS